MKREITITDTTLRDGHQSLWAARMRTGWMIPVAEHQQRAGAHIVDIMGNTHYVTAVRFLREDPWERVRTMRRILTRPALVANAGGLVAGSFRLAPVDINQLFIECSIRNGIDYIRTGHGLYDVDVIVSDLQLAKKLGAKTIAPLIFSLSPVHTDELFETRTREICRRIDVDYVMIKDSGGLLTPERTGSLVDAVRRGAAGRKVTLHTHSMTGLSSRVYMVGVEHGVDDLQCAIWPLAQSSSQPPLQNMVRNLRAEGYSVNIDDREIDAASEYLVELARRQGLPLGAPQEYDAFHYHHQIPGGMITNLEAQLKEAGLLGRLQEVLEETSIVREELGWPTMVTPYSQFVANQALFNIIAGERYSVVPDEIKMYVLGYYGKPLAPIEPNVLDRIMEQGSPDIKAEPEPPKPALPGLRKRHPQATDEELLLRYMNGDVLVDRMLATPRTPAEQWSKVANGRGPTGTLTALLGQVSELTQGGEIVIEKGDVRLRVVA